MGELAAEAELPLTATFVLRNQPKRAGSTCLAQAQGQTRIQNI